PCRKRSVSAWKCSDTSPPRRSRTGSRSFSCRPLDTIAAISFILVVYRNHPKMQEEIFMFRNRNTTAAGLVRRLLDGLTLRRVGLVGLGALVCHFGIHNRHQPTGITEGGVMGLMLLVEHWLGVSPAFITPVLDITCYLLAFKYLGGRFIKISAVSTLSVSLFYKVWELFPPMLPDLSAHPLAAALLGAVFVGVGVGIIVRQGGSSGGDDALALTISKVTRWRLARCYLFTDVVVLVLSLSYIPFQRIAFSLITVTLSSFLIDRVQDFTFRRPVRDSD